MRLTIILRKALAAQANAAIAERTGNEADNLTFTNALEKNGNEVAYWCCWNFNGRRYSAAQVVNKLQQVLDLTDDEVLTRQDVDGDPPSLATIKMVAFDADKIRPQVVLNYLGLDLPTSEQ